MTKNLFTAFLATIGLCLSGAASLRADPVTVQEVGVGANQIVTVTSSTVGTVTVYAGVIDLLVNGTPTDSFCIDPWHFSSGSPQSYNTEPLSDGPKPVTGSTLNPMGATVATEIEQLWQNYVTPGLSNTTAAALQIEIWDLVASSVTTGTFTLDSAPSAVLSTLSDMQAWLADNPSAPTADLFALTGPGQDYVVQQNPGPNMSPVPDGGSTIALLGLGLIGLFIFQKKQPIKC